MVLCLVAVAVPAGSEQGAASRELGSFKEWLARERPGYGCDEGPARFRNATVEAAYPGQRFYYVLTYTRGIPPPFRNPTTVIARVGGDGSVRPLRDNAGFREGLRKVSSAKEARVAAAAVLILATADPGERRWGLKPDLFRAKRNSSGWRCTYRHDAHRESWVTFDRRGILSGFSFNAPPVP